MPTYTYRCQSCGIEFDKHQSFNDKPLTKCPECRKGTVRRVPQASAVVFKGSGWYINDSKSKSSTTLSTSKTSETKAEKSESGEKSEKSDKPAKTETKSESKTTKSDD